MIMVSAYFGRVGIIQRVLSPYRIPVFDLIANDCADGLSVASGKKAVGETLEEGDRRALRVAQHGELLNHHLFNGRYYLCWQSGIINWLNEWNPDILVVEANPRLISTIQAITWMHKRDRPVIGHGLGVMPLTPGFKSLRNWGRRANIHQYDAIIAYSSLAAEQYSKLGVSCKRIFVAYNAVASQPNSPMPLRTRDTNRPTRILFVGRLLPGKRVDMLLTACSRLPAGSLELWIVGEGPERQRLEIQAQKLKSTVLFCGDMRGQALRNVFCEADLFVLPGLGGLAVQEAMSYGLPVIVADGDGTQFDLVSKENGWTIQPGDINALELSLREALKNRDRLRLMGRHSYHIVKEKINIECMASSFIQVFSDLKGTQRTNLGQTKLVA
ncbi:MAG: glycosyltransferase family 4 protein [Nitrospira sp.]|nr:glycosyltransferase family 4 protein [Nitrospira sp.]